MTKPNVAQRTISVMRFQEFDILLSQEFCQALKSDPKIFRNYFKVSGFNCEAMQWHNLQWYSVVPSCPIVRRKNYLLQPTRSVFMCSCTYIGYSDYIMHT